MDYSVFFLQIVVFANEDMVINHKIGYHYAEYQVSACQYSDQIENTIR